MNDLIWGTVGFLLTVMVLSYLIGDNFFFRLAVHIFIGLTTGYVAVLIIRHVFWPLLILPIQTGSWPSQLWMALPLFLILLLLLSQIRRFSDFGSIPLAFLAGLTAAVAVGGAVFGTLVPQIRAVIDAFDPGGWIGQSYKAWWRIAEAVVMLIGVIGALSYFHFGRKLKISQGDDLTRRPLVFEVLGKVGQVFIGLSLGTIFAGVFSTALLALISRIGQVGQFIQGLLGGY